MSIIVAVDTGGTFTDLAAYNTDRRQIQYTKTLTNYTDLVAGVLDCIEKAKVDLRQTELVKLGTTLVINTYLQRAGARTALVTTKGHRDILEIRRGNRTSPFDLRFAWDAPLIPREWRYEVDERVTAEGAILNPLLEAEMAGIAENLRQTAIEALAISFVNSYRNSVHEEQAAAYFRRTLPGVYVTAGTELSREWYEYERTSTAAANAYVGPRLQDYVGRLAERLLNEGFSRKFFLMGSNGGVFSPERAQQQPVMLVESGPVGGCIGASAYARELGLEKLIAFDMGGTTAKCALIEGGRYDVKSPYFVGGPERGFPVRGAVVDIVEVGAGGGSIAWFDAGGRLNVGPRSAGSTPGPVAYGRGGEEPTITDANLILGRIAASNFLAGELTLHEQAAALAMQRKVAEPLGFSGEDGLDEVAQGVIDLGTTIMAGAIKQITVQRGHDPRDFVLFVFGGGGPLHGAALARELGIGRVIVPPRPGIFSALGMLLADARVDHSETFLHPLAADVLAEAHETFNALEVRIGPTLAQEVAASKVLLERKAELRYKGQRQAIRISVGAHDDLEDLRSSFQETYRKRFGHVDQGGPIEFVNLVVVATATMMRPDPTCFADLPLTAPPGQATRMVYFAEEKRRVNTAVYVRDLLPQNFAASGPAIIEEYGSSTIVGPKDSFSVGALGELSIMIHQ